MHTPARRTHIASLLLAPVAFAALAATAGPAAAQADGRDSTRLADRLAARHADRTLVTREGDVVLMIAGEDLYIQLTDRGLRQIETPDEDDEAGSLGGAILGAMLRAGVRKLMDRAIVYPITELGRAEYVDDRLVLEDREGDSIMDMTVNDREILADFRAREARAFARELRRRMRADD